MMKQSTSNQNNFQKEEEEEEDPLYGISFDAHKSQEYEFPNLNE